MFVETNTQKAKSHRQRAVKMKQLSKRLPDKKDRQALLGLAVLFLQQADELERTAHIAEAETLISVQAPVAA